MVNGGTARACLGSTLDEAPSPQIVKCLGNSGKTLDCLVFLALRETGPLSGTLFPLETDGLLVTVRARAGEDRGFPERLGGAGR